MLQLAWLWVASLIFLNDKQIEKYHVKLILCLAKRVQKNPPFPILETPVTYSS